MSERVYTQVYVGVGAFLEQNGTILFVQEGKAKARGKWNDPGGWMDLGEDVLSAVKREVKEETGLDFTPTGLIGIYNSIKRNPETQEILGHCLKLMFRGTWSGTLTCDGEEILDLKWFTPEEIENMDQTMLRSMDNKQIIKDYFSGKSFPLETFRNMLR